MEKEKELSNINNSNKKEELEKFILLPLQESFDFYEQNEKENQKNNTSTEDLLNDKKKIERFTHN